MTKNYYTRFDGFYYTAMCTADGARKMDLPEARVARREEAGRLFFRGWVEALENLGIIVRFEYQTRKFLWLVDSDAASHVLGCSPQTVLKYLEIMRYLRFISKTDESLPGRYGYMSTACRDRISPHEILGVVDFVVDRSTDSDGEIDSYTLMDPVTQATDDQFELPIPRPDYPPHFWSHDIM